MKFSRRGFLAAMAAAIAGSAVDRSAAAQTYPVRPVRFLVGFPPGNAPDIIARLMGQWLSDQLGQQFVIENRPGAASNIAAEALVNAAPDGYTVFMLVLTNAFNAMLYPKLSFNLLRDMAPVASIADAPYMVALNPSVPAKTLPEFIAYAKAYPGRINMASGGSGSSSHVFGELFKMLAGVDLVHVPYRSSFMPDLLSGQVQVTFAPTPQAIEYFRNGQIRVLAVTTAKRLDAFPELPTVGEFVPGYEAIGWYGLSVPKNTPLEIVGRLNEATNAALADPKLKARLAAMGVQPMVMQPREFRDFVAAEIEKWGKVIKAAGIKAE